MTDRVGHLWVREYDFPGQPRAAPLWTVFDKQGWMLGFVETPMGLRFYEIGDDYILGRHATSWTSSRCSSGRWRGVRGNKQSLETLRALGIRAD